MFKLRSHHLLCFFNLAALGCLACTDSGMAVSGAGIATSTSGSSTTPEVPTTGASGDGPTPTTTMITTTGTGSTAAEVGTSSSGADTPGGISPCGDGIGGPGEECDDGAGNGDTRFCKEDCTLNVCGDGKLFVGWELCDQGAGNSDEYGSLCGSMCTPGARCGDHKLQPEFETCDLGQGNGGVKGDEQEILCDVSCRALQLRGFVTAAAFTGNLGGLFGADLKCRNAAAAAGLAEPERFHALLSTGDVDAKSRFMDVATSWPYVLVTGKKFADSFAALIEVGPLGEGISVTETGAAIFEKYVATNTTPGGVHFSPDQHCQGWTSARDRYATSN
ncbi:MAG: hypothetical protein H0T76_19070, partial [Nannocystis sp.]|nr:hypothetical protein [Nannocystis sp.]